VTTGGSEMKARTTIAVEHLGHFRASRLGKSVTLRLLVHKLAPQRDLAVGILTRPQTGVPDFYRELGDLFGVELSPHNRWAGSRVLRERWQAHIEASLLRPVLLIDEAQEMKPAVLNELRLLCAAELDARALLTIVLAGDGRLPEKFRAEELLPLGSRIRVRLLLQSASPLELLECLRHALTQAGNPRLMTKELMTTVLREKDILASPGSINGPPRQLPGDRGCGRTRSRITIAFAHGRRIDGFCRMGVLVRMGARTLGGGSDIDSGHEPIVVLDAAKDGESHEPSS
jgi:hypothetical protein